MQGLIYGQKKPALTRRSSSKREIASWAEETYKGIKMLGDILSGDAERRSTAMAQRRKEVDEKTREAKVHIENLRKWNPGKEFKDVESVPDAVEVIRRVLEGIGYRAGDKVALPLTRVELNQAGNGYNVSSPGKQGAYWFKRYHSTLDEAIETMVLAGKLSRGDMDAEIPQRQYSIRGIGEAHQEPTGKYVVMYFAKNGYDLKEVVFGSKEKADVFAKERNGKVVAQQRRINEYDSYQVVVINPLTGNNHTLKDGFGTRLEASAWLEENTDEVNGMALEAIHKETGTKGEPRAHFYVTSTYSHGKMVYCVVENDRGNPWPEVKDFSSHKEAESWLKDNIGRLEAERKQRKEAERAVVYYNTSGERIGEDYRNGNDATPESFSEAFGFRGVQFGNWTNAADRQTALNQAYDALMDLAHILNVPALALSLDGELGLAFGARGGGRASAHYEPVEVVINLTKTQGAGALAHEWWHALDNYLSRRAGVTMGYASHRNGIDKMSATVKVAVENLLSKIDKSGYAKRSRDKGDYWGRGTEVMARLFESWVAWKMGKSGKLSPFLSAGINPKSQELYQALNYLAYSATEKRRAEREGREPAIMSKEEFYETPESLSGYPYPTESELAEFAPQVDALFSALSNREGESGSMAGEPRRRYRGGQMAGKSLFDWAEENVREQRHEVATDEQSAAAEEANGAIDEYAAAYKEYVEATARLEKGLVEAGANEEEAAAIREQMESNANMAVEARERLRESLKEYYVRENTPEDAEQIARDMSGRVEAEVGVRLNKEQVLRDILGKGTAEKASAETVETEGKHVTTGGGNISYNAVGHLPEAKVGEFAYVERQFSRTGEFLFTGNEVIRDRGDVAYIFRSLENYSVENVFAVFVKDGRGHILHIGMGGPLASYADMGAVRAGYDAFGADEIYLVHNHPSGVMKASAQDRNLIRKLEAAFEGKVKTEGIIMDTTSGRYVTFDGNNKTEVAERPREGGESAAEVMRFDGVERYGEDKGLTVIRSSEDVARFVSERRLGNGDKVSYMVLSNNNEIIGNFHTDYGSLEADGLADEMASVATKFGGTSVIVYGNVGLKGASRLGAEVGRKSLNGVRLLDALEITNGLNRSALDQGMMSEGVAAYGSEVREPMVSGRGREEFDAMRYRTGWDKSMESRNAIVEETNKRFNEELQQQIDGTLPEGHVYQLGTPSEVLLSAGVPNLPIQLSAQRLKVKATEYGHNFDLGEIQNLVKELQSPMAVFVYGNKGKMQNIIVGIESNGNQFIVGLSLNPIVQGRALEINSIRNVFPKKNAEWLNWISQGKLLYADKQKIQALIDKQRTNLADVEYLDLEDVAKIVNNFENPTLDDDKIVRYRDGDESSAEAKSSHAEKLAKKFNTPIQVVTDPKELTSDNAEQQRRMRKSKGFYDPATGKVVVVLPNNANVEDVAETVFHEVVAHKGLREMLGDENYEAFCDEVYDHLKDDLKEGILNIPNQLLRFSPD